jgi:hypothetical protein
MHALMIGPTEREAIKKLKAYAAEDLLSPGYMLYLAKFNEPAFRDMMKSYSIALPVDYSVTYTHEIHAMVRAHHISISANSGLPAVAAVNMILEEFGMIKLDVNAPNEMVKIYREDWQEDDKHYYAVNVIQLMLQ